MSMTSAASQDLYGTLILCSDLHIRSADDLRCQLLLDILERINPEKTRYFVLNGDIFDFCFGPSNYFRHKFSALGKALERLAERGVRVILVEGNHEFHLHEIGWRGVEFFSDDRNQPLILSLDEQRQVAITHGDLIKKDRLYFTFRKVVKSSLVKWLVRLLPGHWLDLYALKHAQLSRKADHYRQLDHKGLMAATIRWLEKIPANTLIFGHFHTPYAEVIKQKSVLSVESWDRPNLLIYREHEFQRVYLTQKGAPFSYQPARSILQI